MGKSRKSDAMIPRCAMMVNSASNSRWWPFWVRLISLVRNEKPCTVHQTMLQKILFVKQTCKMYRISLTCSNLSSCFFWAHNRVMWWTDCKCVRTIAFRANKKGLFSPSVICCATDFKSGLKFNLEGHACNLNFTWMEIGGIGRSFEQCKIPLWFFEFLCRIEDILTCDFHCIIANLSQHTIAVNSQRNMLSETPTHPTPF